MQLYYNSGVNAALSGAFCKLALKFIPPPPLSNFSPLNANPTISTDPRFLSASVLGFRSKDGRE
jgi:hypothetical protein